MIDASAPSQRAGVLASLSMIGEAFQLVPDRAGTKGTWSAYEWAQHRKGWLFLTSTPHTLDRLRPLISAWFDLLLMRPHGERRHAGEFKIEVVRGLRDRYELICAFEDRIDVAEHLRRGGLPVFLYGAGQEAAAKELSRGIPPQPVDLDVIPAKLIGRLGAAQHDQHIAAFERFDRLGVDSRCGPQVDRWIDHCHPRPDAEGAGLDGFCLRRYGS